MSLSLRGRIVVATFLPLILFGLLAAAVGVSALTSTAEDLARQRQTALANVAAAGLASNLQSGVRVLDVTARELGDLNGSPEKQQDLLLDRVSTLNAFTAVILLDAEGSAQAVVPPGTPTAGFDFANQRFFREARAVQSPVFSGVFQYTPTGAPVAVVAVPVRSQGTFSGVLVGGISLARPEWARDLNLVRSPGGSTAYLVDGEGTVIYRPGSAVIGDSVRLDAELWQLASAGSPGVTVYRPGGKGEEVVVTYSPVGVTGWGLFVEEPWEPIVAPVVPAQVQVAALMGLGIIIALVALVVSLGRAVGPLGLLVEQGRRVAEGKPFRPIPEQGPSDLRVLLRAVNQMVSRLEEQQQALRSYAAEVLRAQEEERLRLSRDLHDGAVQELVALIQRLELCRDAIQSGPPAVEARLQEAQTLAQKGVVELRRMSNYLRPSILEDLGLVPALRHLVKEAEQQLPEARTSFEVVGEEARLPSELELTVFRIAQEALSNVRKHAPGSRSVSVALILDQAELTLVVEDDGAGFVLAEPGDLLRQGHLGLTGMAERARLCNGELALESALGKGTTVILRLPLEAPSLAAREPLVHRLS
jgi:signal transduction histidine kinase